MDGLIAPRHSEVTLKIREKIEQAQETASNRELGVLKELLSDSLHKDGLFQECLDALSAATDIYVGYNDLKALTRLCNKAGCTNFVMNRYKEAIELFERQTSYGMEGKKVVAACQGMTNKGVVMLLTADQEGAISTIKEAMGLLEQESETIEKITQKCFLHHVQATIMIANGNFASASPHLSTCLSLAMTHSLKYFSYVSQTNLGICKLKEFSFDEAFDLFKSAMDHIDSSFQKAKGLYHLSICHMRKKKTDACDDVLKEALQICNVSVAELAEERRKEEERIRKEEEEKERELMGENAKLKEFPHALSEEGSLATIDSLMTIPNNLPVAFGTQEGAILHSQILNLSALNQMCRLSGGFNDPNIDAALESITQSLSLSSRLYSPLAKALTLNNYALVCSVLGDNEGARKYHGQNLRIIEDDRSYKFQAKVVDGKADLGPEVSTVLEHNSFTNSIKDKKMLRSKAAHNQAISGRNGMGMGLALESGTGAIETAKLRPVMDALRRNYEACDRNVDHRGSAMAHGALGSIVTAVGGRKADAFSNLEHQLNYSREVGDKFMEAQALRTLSELQEFGGDLKVAVKTLKAYAAIAGEAGNEVLISDSCKRLVNVYTQVGKERKPLDVPMEEEEYGRMTDEELDEMEGKDDMFMRANGTLRAKRYAKMLQDKGGYWGWTTGGGGGGKTAKNEDEWMENLKKPKGRGSGGGGIFGGLGKKKAKPKNGLLSMFG